MENGHWMGMYLPNNGDFMGFPLPCSYTVSWLHENSIATPQCNNAKKHLDTVNWYFWWEVAWTGWGEVVALEFVETLHLVKGHGTEISSKSLGKPEREPYTSQVYLGLWMSDPKVQCAPTPLPTGSIIYVPTFTIIFPPNVGKHAILPWILWVSRWIISRYWLNIYELTTRWRGEYCPSNSSKLTDLEFGSTPEWCKIFGPSIISTVPLDFQTNSPEQIVLDLTMSHINLLPLHIWRNWKVLVYV